LYAADGVLEVGDGCHPLRHLVAVRRAENSPPEPLTIAVSRASFRPAMTPDGLTSSTNIFTPKPTATCRRRVYSPPPNNAGCCHSPDGTS
jgi:hypothetical protein